MTGRKYGLRRGYPDRVRWGQTSVWATKSLLSADSRWMISKISFFSASYSSRRRRREKFPSFKPISAAIWYSRIPAAFAACLMSTLCMNFSPFRANLLLTRPKKSDNLNTGHNNNITLYLNYKAPRQESQSIIQICLEYRVK